MGGLLKPVKYDGARGVCRCGHLGDVPHGAAYGQAPADLQHTGPGGHGRCMVAGCACVRFTWVRWTPGFRAALTEAQSRAKRPRNR
jgi:hypothetical protein